MLAIVDFFKNLLIKKHFLPSSHGRQVLLKTDFHLTVEPERKKGENGII